MEGQTVLEGVTILTRTFMIEYISQGEVVGRFVTEIRLTPGETYVINDPNWVDVGDFGPAVGLEFMVEPSDGLAGSVLEPSVTVVVVDALGRQVEDFDGSVAVALGPESPPGILTGATTVDAVDGIATFSDLTVDRVGQGFVLVASSGSLVTESSTSFNIAGATFTAAAGSVVYRAVADSANATSTCGDFNNDGINDAAVAVDGEIHVLVGAGNGELQLSTVLPLSGVTLVRSGDVTGDGNDDLVALVGLTTSLYVSDGNGGFAAPVDTSTGLAPGTVVNDFTVVDLTQDGLADTVFAAQDGLATAGAYGIQLSDGSQLNGLGGQAVASPVREVQAGQLVGGAAPDLAMTTGANVTVLAGTGNGTFGTSTTLSPAPSAPPQSLALADFDNLNGLDVALVYSQAGNSVTAVYLNGGAGDFSQASGSPYSTGQGASSVGVLGLVAGDINGDSIPDLVHAVDETYSSRDELGLWVQLSSTGSNLFPDSAFSRGTGAASGVQLCDLSADGLLDAVYATEDGLLYRLNSTPDGKLLPLDTPGKDAGSVATADVNADGREDLVVYDSDAAVLDAYLRGTDGALPDSPSFTSPAPGSNDIFRMADMNDDGFPDAVLGAGATNGVRILPNVGGGSFDNANRVDLTLTRSYKTLEVGRLNTDQYPDLAAADTDPNVQVIFSDGPLSYGPQANVPTSSPLEDLTLVNLDSDPELEIVTAMGVTGIGVIENQDGSLSEELAIELDARAVNGIASGDLNGDGSVDVVATSEGPEFAQHHLLFNNGTVNLIVNETLDDSRVFSFQETIIGDVNGDAAADVLVGDEESGGIEVFTGRGNGTFNPSPITHYYAGGKFTGDGSFLLSDLDGDGRAEIVAVTRASGALVTLLTLLLLYGLRFFRGRLSVARLSS